MVVRDGVDRLVKEFTANDEWRVEEAVRKAGALIDKSMVRSSELAEGFPPFGENLGDDYAALVLTQEELDAITLGLLELLDRPPSVVSAAAFALRNSGRLYAVPKLAEALRRLAPEDGMHARQAIVAIWDIVTVTDRGRDLSLEEETAIEAGRAALWFTTQTAVEDSGHAREAAMEALEDISWYLRRSTGRT